MFIGLAWVRLIFERMLRAVRVLRKIDPPGTAEHRVSAGALADCPRLSKLAGLSVVHTVLNMYLDSGIYDEVLQGVDIEWPLNIAHAH